jgi:siroheme synthase (precorrin-2 oxidase/ferrochelatase)
MIVLFVYSRLSNFSASRRLHNYRRQGCKFKHSMLSTSDKQQSGSFYVPYLLRLGTLVYTVSSEGLAGIYVQQWDSNSRHNAQDL